MMRKFVVTAALTACVLVVPVSAQTASQLLEKGIYAQETSGDLDAAIQIYRQLVGSAFGQRDIAAQAQYRLAETLIKKGDLSSAATEFQKLARDYSDYQALISRLAGRFPEPKKPQNPGPGILIPQMADSSRPFKARGEVFQVQWINPLSYILLKDGGANQLAVAMAAPSALIQGGLTRNSIKQGDRVVVDGFWTQDDRKGPDGLPLVIASTIVSEDGRKLFDRTAIPNVAREALLMEMAKTLETLHHVQEDLVTPTQTKDLRIKDLEKKLEILKKQAVEAEEAAKK